MGKKLITIHDEHRGSIKSFSIQLPDTCPWCHSNIMPTVSAQNSISLSTEPTMPFSLILLCPNCKKHFLQSYRLELLTLQNNGYSIRDVIPINDKPIPKSDFEYPEEIDQISIEFKNIISQSTNAEGLGLNHLAGIGYRKALEFLVKDYLIKHLGLDEEKISKKSLGNCIDQDIKDDRLKALSKAATWIGNDETHYVRKHTNRDINDMKNFLHKMTLFISYELAIEDASDFTS